jgi:hypothetical protein
VGPGSVEFADDEEGRCQPRQEHAVSVYHVYHTGRTCQTFKVTPQQPPPLLFSLARDCSRLRCLRFPSDCP